MTLLGPSEFALRLFPFLCGLASLLLFWRLAVRVLDGYAVPVAVGLFSIGVPLVNYSAEVKQYGVDAMPEKVRLPSSSDIASSSSRKRATFSGSTPSSTVKLQ